MFDPLPIQVYLPDLCSGVRQAKNELILGRCRQAVRIGAGPYDCDIFHVGFPPIVRSTGGVCHYTTIVLDYNMILSQMQS